MQWNRLLVLSLIFEVFPCQQPKTRKRNPLLSRKKRYLAFPEGSNFVITLSGVSNFLRRPTPGVEWKFLGECDVPFPLPSQPSFFLKKKKKKLHMLQRREIYRGLENAFNSNGFNGSACLNSMICEVQKLFKTRSNSLVKNLIFAVFAYREIGEENYRGDPCEKSNFAECGLPFLDYVLGAFRAA